ncbi:hypothetical protein ACFL1Z_01245 [Thermodesulfobacteriota bacterium]
MNLYWVTTEDHAKDWFVAANNAEEATTFHAILNWYELDLVNTEITLELPDDIIIDVGWPSVDELKAFGANILVNKFPRVIEIKGRRYFERLTT